MQSSIYLPNPCRWCGERQTTGTDRATNLFPTAAGTLRHLHKANPCYRCSYGPIVSPGYWRSHGCCPCPLRPSHTRSVLMARSSCAQDDKKQEGCLCLQLSRSCHRCRRHPCCCCCCCVERRSHHRPCCHCCFSKAFLHIWLAPQLLLGAPLLHSILACAPTSPPIDHRVAARGARARNCPHAYASHGRGAAAACR